MKTKILTMKIQTLLLGVTFFILGCGLLKTYEEPPKTVKIIPSYDFSPPAPVAPGSAKINIALFEPHYPSNFAYSDKSPFDKFRISMGKDLEEILTARGFIIKGPYDEYDLMTFSDKQECDLGLVADINIDINETSGGWDYHPPVTTQYGTHNAYNTYGATLSLNGKITLYIIETFTKQKLIVKSLNIPESTITAKSKVLFSPNQNAKGIPVGDPDVHNPIAEGLKSFYQSTMKRAWDLLTKEELERLKAQVTQIRKDGGFIKN